MQCFKLASACRWLLVVASVVTLLQDPALAARPWENASDKPGAGTSKKWGNAPTIQGVPASVANVDEFYAFQPTATDKDGDKLTFSIVNKPRWAAFDTAHGYLSGYPSLTDAGLRTDGIVISVSDGTNTASLPAFSILVSRPVDRPPVIGGLPPSEVLAGQSYSFTPTASDPEGQKLLFSVVNRPRWASFDTSTGRLHGLPGAANVGVYTSIRITVSDGTSSVSMPAFSIAVLQAATGSVTLSWNAPTQNVDGTPLLNLAGYRIHYGPAERQYDYSIRIDNPGVSSAVIDNLTQGTWHFAATAITATGMESDFSAEVQRIVP